MTATATTTPSIVTEDLMIASDTAGIELHLRNKRLASMSVFTPETTILLMHGATYSSGSLFDVALGGFSLMDYLADAGYDVYALDARGYGGSTRPPEMFQPAMGHLPIGRTESGIRDLGSAVDFIREHRHLARLNLVAMSWGGTVAGAYTTRNNDKIAKLALVAPQWLGSGGQTDPGGAIGAYRKVPVLGTRAGWLNAAPAAKRAGLLPPGWFEAWAEATLAEDPHSNQDSPPTLRAVNGPVQDIREFWATGRPFYQPAEIRVPVLLLHAEWDIHVPIDCTQAYFRALSGAPYRRWIEIGEGTHMILLEKNRLQAFDAIRHFLDENFTPAG
ncbi:MAG: alpha/beta fold hydrolase [Azospirillaceae bacterium]|nr:alpha/beta fold hydrolase [Azospirillaceae bacterium]